MLMHDNSGFINNGGVPVAHWLSSSICRGPLAVEYHLMRPVDLSYMTKMATMSINDNILTFSLQ